MVESIDTSKKELEVYLNNKRVPLMLSLFYTKIPKKQLLENLRKSTLKINQDEVDFSTLADSLEEEKQFKKIIEHMIYLAIKNAVTDFYEGILKYCKYSNQESKFRKQEWYYYSRLIRNGLSHNYQWDFSQQNKNIFPVKYKEITIDYNLHGTEMRNYQMSLSTTWALLEEMENFVKTELD